MSTAIPGAPLARLACFACFAGLAALAACVQDSPAGGRSRPAGQESFVSQAPGTGGAGAAPSTAGPGSTTGADASPAAAPGTAPRAVEEADVYRLVGSTLYVLNGLRGLQVVDVADLDHPVLLSRVPVVGQPVDLYLRGTTAVFAVSDTFAYAMVADGTVARPLSGSQVWVVEVADPAHPRVLAQLDVEGFVEQTRFVGDVLYVFSRRWAGTDTQAPAGGVVAAAVAPTGDTVFLASYDFSATFASGQPPRLADRLDFPATGWTSHVNVTSERIVLSQSGWDLGSGGPATTFRAFDITAAGGALRAGATFSAPGLAPDRWALDTDLASGTFRAVLGRGWNAGADVRVWSAATAAEATPLGVVPIDVAEGLTASRFDGARAYVVTAARIDPLWVVDLSDPSRPGLLGHVEMPGQLDFVEPRGDRLVALGHLSGPDAPWQLTLSLFDVADPSQPTLLSRVAFGGSYGWVGVPADDLRKAVQVLDAEGLVLVPFQGWDQATWSYLGGVQLVDWANDALALRGLLAHPGSVQRAFPLPGRPGQLAALSDQRLQLVDATDRDAPRERGGLDLARPVWALAFAGGKAVELSGDWWRGDTWLVVTEPGDPNAPVPLARLDVPAPQATMYPAGAVVWLLARDGSGAGWLEGWDLSDPLRPRRRGRLELGADTGAVGPGWWWGYGDQAVFTGRVLALHRARWLRFPVAGGATAGATGGAVETNPDEVLLFDLADPDAPLLASRVALPASSWSWGLTASGGHLWITRFTWEDPRAGTGRYLLDRIDIADPAHPALLPGVNVPGTFLAAAAGGTRIYTLETTWADQAGTSWLHALDLTDLGTARLAASVGLPGAPGGVALAPRFAYVTTWAWEEGRWRQRLAAVDLAEVLLASSQEVEAQWSWPLAAEGGWLLLGAGVPQGQGVLSYRLDQPGAPVFSRFTRTQGWILAALVHEGLAYLSAGPYGVEVVAP